MRSDVPSATSNVAFLSGPPEKLWRRLQIAKDFFGPEAPWRFVAVGVQPNDDFLILGAQRAGLHRADAEPGMLLDPIPPHWSADVTNLDVGEVGGEHSNSKRFDDFTAVWCASFGTPEWTLPAVLSEPPKSDRASGIRNRLYVGYANGTPVACSAVTVTEGVAGIFCVGTIKGFRGRGYGSAMTRAAIDGGRSIGAQAAYLAATKLGAGVYKRIGFRTVAEYPTWKKGDGVFGRIRGTWAMKRILREETLAVTGK